MGKFKEYDAKQMMLLPPSIQEYVPFVKTIDVNSSAV